MQWQDDIRVRLERYSGFHAEYARNFVTVICDNPEHFSVSLHEDTSGFLVGYDGWHEHFKTLESALDCFAFGLLGKCRLKVTLRGATECAWTLQSYENGEWVEDTTTGLLLVPYWKRKRVAIRHNCIVKIA